MELIVFIVFQLLMEVQSYKSPRVKVSPDVIRESSSVKISCETPADVRVNQCNFYINKEDNKIKVSSSCELDLTGAEVLRWAAVKSPESIYIYCYYTIDEQGINKPSNHSPPATVTVLDSLQKPIIGASGDDNLLDIVCEIPLSVRTDFICSLYTEDDVLLHQRVSQRRQSGESSFCVFYLSHSELFSRSVNSRQLICVYSLKTQPEIRSPHSDTYTIRGLPRARLTASASVILETDTVELSCENTEDLKMEMCVFIINGRESNTKQSSSCQLSLTGSQISVWSGGQSSSVRITCFTVMKSNVQKPSAHSDPVTVTVQISSVTSTGKTTAASAPPDSTRETGTSVPHTVHTHSEVSTSTTTEQTTTTAMKTSLTIMSTSETTTYSKTLDLHSNTNLPTNTEKETMSGSTATSTQKTSQIDTVISTFETPVSRRTELSSVSVALTEGPPTLKYKDIWVIVLVFTGVAVILSGLVGLICLCRYASKKRKRNKTRSIKPDVPSQGIGMSCSGSAETYSLITSVPATSQLISADVLVHKQQKQGNLEENENVYHLYCTIPEKPVHSDAGDQAYSLVKMHC